MEKGAEGKPRTGQGRGRTVGLDLGRWGTQEVAWRFGLEGGGAPRGGRGQSCQHLAAGGLPPAGAAQGQWLPGYKGDALSPEMGHARPGRARPQHSTLHSACMWTQLCPMSLIPQ